MASNVKSLSLSGNINITNPDNTKDVFYPTDGKNLGIEVPLGEGLVNFPMLISKLKKFGYDGAITIEREISGEKQIADIIKAKTFLEKIIEQEDIRC